jgi:hypothetical protein
LPLTFRGFKGKCFPRGSIFLSFSVCSCRPSPLSSAPLHLKYARIPWSNFSSLVIFWALLSIAQSMTCAAEPEAVSPLIARLMSPVHTDCLVTETSSSYKGSLDIILISFHQQTLYGNECDRTIASVAFVLWRVKQAANKLCWLASMCKYNT